MPSGQNKPRRTLTVMEGRTKNLPMVKGFAAAAKKRGWDFCQLDLINSDKISRLDFDDIPLDYVVFRDLTRNNYYEAERVIEFLLQKHIIGMNMNVTGNRSATSDKHYQHGLFLLDPTLKKYTLPSFEAKSAANVRAYITWDRVHYPIVLKSRHGTAGKDIILVEKAEDLKDIKNYDGMIIEQYIKPECDYRVFVIGGTAVGVMRKSAHDAEPGNFEAWSAGRKKNLETDPDTLDVLSEIATRAAAISRLEYAGVDIIKSKDDGEFYLLETNFAAGWANGFINTTKVDIPDLVIEWFEDMDEGRNQPIATAITKYIEKRLKYLPERIQKSYQAILDGDVTALVPYQSVFANYEDQYLYDAGNIFKKLSKAYQDIIANPQKASETAPLIEQIESMPLSWAGNFIGPEVGTLHDGAILSALYLYLLHKTKKI